MKWLVVSATGEPQALRDTFEEAAAAVDDVERYWELAEASGGARYVAKLRPFRLRAMPPRELEEFLRDGPVPVIDREP